MVYEFADSLCSVSKAFINYYGLAMLPFLSTYIDFYYPFAFYNF